MSYDLPYAFRLFSDTTPREVLIISMDPPSSLIMHKGSIPDIWSRTNHIRLLDKAVALGAEAVVFDMKFFTRWPDPEVDRQFGEAIERAQPKCKVVVGALVQEYPIGQGQKTNLMQTTVLEPVPPYNQVAGMGVTNLPKEGDDVIRRHYVNTNSWLFSLAWKTAAVLGRGPEVASRERWIRYYGPRRKLSDLRYDHFMSLAEDDPTKFKGRVLFVGWNPLIPSLKDEHPTPYSSFTGEPTTGVEIHATIFANLVRGEWIEEWSALSEWLFIVGVGFLAGLVLGRLRSGWAAILGILGILGVTIGACVIYWTQREWFPWLVTALVQFPVAIAWSVVTRAQVLEKEKEELETLIATRPQPLSPADSPQGVGSESPTTPEESPRRLPTIPDHELVRCVGRGAYGEVWLARDVIGTHHAVKVIYRNTFVSADPYEREFRGIQKFTPISRIHRGWVHVLHVGRNDELGYFFYVMEVGDDAKTGQAIDEAQYVPRNLAAEIQEGGALSLNQTLEWGIALAQALQHLHDHSLIHRDIKPSNVIFVHDEPKFADIGLVTDVRGTVEVSQIGTVGYIAPEGPGTPAGDIYSLGKVLYEMAYALDVRAFPEMPTFMLEHDDDHESHRLYRILLKACHTEPEKRYRRASDLADDLGKLKAELEKD